MAFLIDHSNYKESRPQDLQIRLKSTLERALKSQRAKQLPEIYRNKLCRSAENLFIHRYADGRRYLIRQNRYSASEQVVRELR